MILFPNFLIQLVKSIFLMLLTVVVCEYLFCPVVQVFPAHFLKKIQQNKKKRKEKESRGSWTQSRNLYEYFCVYILLWCTLHLIIIHYDKI